MMERITEESHWIQRDGTPIKYTDMDDGHLINTIKMMKRNVELYKERAVYRQIGISEEFCTSHLDILGDVERLQKMPDDEFLNTFTSYRRLKEEAERRGLHE